MPSAPSRRSPARLRSSRRTRLVQPALFQCLESAYSAAGVPVRNVGSPTDYRVQIGLWVSALAVLVRTGATDGSEKRLRARLGSARWWEQRWWVRRRRSVLASDADCRLIHAPRPVRARLVV
jgi:hypothetical protein